MSSGHRNQCPETGEKDYSWMSQAARDRERAFQNQQEERRRQEQERRNQEQARQQRR